MKTKLIAALFSTTVLFTGVTPGFAATSTWTGAANALFTNPANWSPGFPGSGSDVLLGATPSVDLTGWNSSRPAGYWPLGNITFQASSPVQITGSDGWLGFVGNIIQSGAADVLHLNVAFDLGTSAHTLLGAGTGKVEFRGGTMAGTGPLSISGSYYLFSDVKVSSSSFSVNTGGKAEIRSMGSGDLILPAPGSPSPAGAGDTLNLNGGTLILSTENPSGKIAEFNGRTASFGPNGGTLIWARNVVFLGGPGAFLFNNGTQPAWLVNGNPMTGYYDPEQALQFPSFSTGNGDVRLVLTNGAVAVTAGRPTAVFDPANPKTNVFSRMDCTLTLIGQPNGNPVNPTAGTEVGRYLTANWGDSWNSSTHTNRGNIQVVAGGIYTRNVLHIIQRNSNPRFLGSDITVEDGITVFSGGGLSSTRTLNLGTGEQPGLANTTLRVKPGATAILDQQVFETEGSAGVRLNANTILEEGASMKITRSYQGYAGRPIVVTGFIEGQGNAVTGKDSLLLVDLPLAREDQFGRNDSAYTDPVTWFPGGSQGGGVLVDDAGQYQNSTGVKFYPEWANLVVNAAGSPLMGLRVQGFGEYLTNLLSAPRLNAVSGSQGTLTIAATNDTFYEIDAGPTNLLANAGIGFDSQNGNFVEYVVTPGETFLNWHHLVLRNARLRLKGSVNMVKPVYLAGGTLLIDDAAIVTLGTLSLVSNATIELGNVWENSKLSFTSLGSWPAGKRLFIANWSGSVNGGGAEQIRIGNAAAMTKAQLDQITWILPQGGLDIEGAVQLPTGEIVPNVGQASLVVTSTPQGVQLQVSGAPGQTYVVDKTVNLVPPLWIPVATNTGSFLFADPAPGNPSAFYRARQP